MKLFDLHCDTLSEMLRCSQRLTDNNLQVSLLKASRYEMYAQIFAVWSDPQLTDDDNYRRFFEIVRYAASELKPSDNFAPYLAAEGGKLLGGQLSRLDELYHTGMRFLTLVWSDECCVGGAHNTQTGLTGFGFDVVRKCFALNIIPDLSHSSDKTFYEVCEIASEAEKPVVATHSNSRAVCSHTRNLSDDMFRHIVKSGGITGISLCRPHLSTRENCDIDSVVAHIEHYLALGGEKTVCLGCDLDGIGSPPDGIAGVDDLYKIACRLGRRNIKNETIEDIFFNNAYSFMKNNNLLPELNI